MGTEGDPLYLTPEASIGFGWSTSPNYSRVVELATSLSGYSATGEGKQIMHSVCFRSAEAAQFNRLIRLVESWKSTVFLIDGEQVPQRSINACSWCVEHRNLSSNPELYCYGMDYPSSTYSFANDLGCRHCRVSPYGLTPFSGCSYYQPDGSLIIDREAMHVIVEDNLADYKWCPHLDWDALDADIRAMPDVVTQFTPGWETSSWGLSKRLPFGVQTHHLAEKTPESLRSSAVKNNSAGMPRQPNWLVAALIVFGVLLMVALMSAR